MKATELVSYQIPVTFKCDITIKSQAEKENSCPECICCIELIEQREQRSPETRTVIGQFKGIKGSIFKDKLWIPKGDNIIARIAKMEKKPKKAVI
jgi:hypothetical protein